MPEIEEIILETPYVIPAIEEKVFNKLFLMSMGVNLMQPNGGEASLLFVPANDDFTEFAEGAQEHYVGSMDEWRANIPEVNVAWYAVTAAARAVREYEIAKQQGLSNDDLNLND